MSEVDEQCWIMDFDSICAAIALELGRDPSLHDVREALVKYYRQQCFWEFDSISFVMAEQVKNTLTS